MANAATSNVVDNPTTTGGGDIATRMLDTFFGPDWANFINLAQNGGSLSGAAGVLGAMFEVFNAAVLAATAVIIFYTVSAGVAQTAHEGQVFGRRYSSLWMPIRSALGASMIAPVVGGFSFIQALILMMAGFSIAFANMTTSKLLDWMSAGKPIIEVAQTPLSQTSDMVGAVLTSEVCLAYYNKMTGKAYSPQFEKRFEFVGAPVLEYKTDAGLGILTGFSDHCGKITLNNCGDESGNCVIIEQGIENMRNILAPVVDNIINGVENTDNSAMLAAIAAWKDTEKQVRDAAKQAILNNYGQKLQEFKNQAIVEGWVKLGQWYWTLSSINSKYHELAAISYEYTPPSVDFADPNSGEMGGYAEYAARAYRYLAATGEGTQNPNASPEAKEINAALTGEITGHSSSNFEAQLTTWLFKAVMVKDGDPLQRMMNVGHTIIQGVAVAAAGGYLLSKILPWEKIKGVADKVGSLLKKKGDNDSGGGGGFFSGLGSVMSILLIFLLIIALALAYYLPSIPFIVWTMAVIGWLVMLMQALLAGPIWAASHALPEGEGLAGQHAKQGYMLFLNVMLRPVLLTIGLIMSFLVLWGGAWLVMSGLQVFASGMINAANTGLFGKIGGNYISAFIGMFALLMIGTGLMIAVAHRAFDVIYEAADEVLAWIGGGKQLGGEAQNVSKVQTIVGGNFSKLEHKAIHALGAGQRGHAAKADANTQGAVTGGAVKDISAYAQHLPHEAQHRGAAEIVHGVAGERHSEAMLQKRSEEPN
ncbi:MAG: DotA/TraY family protein [Halothiobacillaceae bacterium]